MATDWDALHRRLWEAVKAHSARVGETAEEYTRAIIEAVRAGGGALTPEAAQILTDYLDAGDGLIREGIERAVAPIADVGQAVAAMRSAVIDRAVEEAFSRRWPDGLRLSDRVWRWQEETRVGVSRVLAEGVRVGRGIGGIMMDMQRSIEAVSGERFNIQAALGPDWADDLSAAAKGYIKTPSAKMGWNAVVREAQAKVASLKVGGTRRQAEHALEQIRKAVDAGRADLVDQALKWWTYDRQQYALRRIVRTEMATAHHRAVIAASIDDEDVVGYLWRLSPSHPEWDICDIYAGVDYGLGKGVFPPDKVPAGKAHPHCFCSLTPTTRKMRKDGERGQYTPEALLEAAGAKGVPPYRGS
jgi:hypothetical protein